MFCSYCGTPLNGSSQFCPKCGAANKPLTAAPVNNTSPLVENPTPASAPAFSQANSTPNYSAGYTPAPPVTPVAPPPPVKPVIQNMEPHIPEEYTPLSPWAYFGLSLLFAIPIIGFIFLIIFSFNGSNINRRNYARSYWCIYLIVLIIFIILSASGALFALSY